jgi:hypothetical protein
VFALARPAFFIPDMFQVLVPEIPHRGQGGVRCGTAQHTETGLGHGLADGFKLIQVLFLPVTPGDFFQYIEDLGGADPAG